MQGDLGTAARLRHTGGVRSACALAAALYAWGLPGAAVQAQAGAESAAQPDEKPRAGAEDVSGPLEAQPGPDPSEAATGAEAEESEAAAAQAQAASEAEMGAADTEAREHFRIGKTFYEAGRFEEAGQEFQRAYELSKRPQLLYNVYVAFRDAHVLPEAIVALRAYLDEVPDAPERVNLKARLASMEKAQVESEQAQAADAEQAPAPATRIEVQRSKLPLILLSVGGAMVVGSAITGGITMVRVNDLETDPSATQAEIDAARALAISTDVLLFGGLATAATGFVLHLTGVLDERREVPVTAGCGRSGCGIRLHGRF